MDTILKTLYTEAYGFLMNKADKSFVAKQLECPPRPGPERLEDVFRRLLEAVVFTRRMQEIIGPVETLAASLFGFDPNKTHSHYGDQWDRLYEHINGQPGPHPVEDDQVGHWETFCRGALTGAEFLSQLGCLETFRAFVRVFQNNDMAMAVLPLLLQNVIYGMTFPMACAFLNNAGYPDYISPDPKVKALLMDIGITESMDNYEALKTLILIAHINQKPTEHIHKIFWLISNGALSEDGKKDKRYRKEYMDHIIPILNCLNYQPQQHQL